MGGPRRLRIAAEWRLTALLAVFRFLTAAPAAVTGEQMTITRMYRAAPVDVVMEVVQGDSVAAGASSFAAAQLSMPARVTASASAASTLQPSELPQQQQLESKSSSVASIPLGGCPQTNFVLPVLLSYDGPDGSPGLINVILDSGSADFAIASTACDSSCSGVPGAFPVNAPGDTDYTDELSYGSADIFGVVFGEAILLPGGLPTVGIAMLAITTQKGLLKKVTCAFGGPSDYLYTGILGFGPDETARIDTASIMGILAAAGVPKVFAPALCPEGGTLYVGGYDSSVVAAAPLYTPLYAAGTYTQPNGQPLYAGYLVQVAAISMNGHDLGLDTANTVWLMDTGTNFLELPPTVAANAAAILDGPMQQLTGISSFFANEYCTYAIPVTPAQINAALPTLDFTFPSTTKGQGFTGSFAATGFMNFKPFINGTYQYCSFSTSNAADDMGANILPNTMMVRTFSSCLLMSRRSGCCSACTYPDPNPDPNPDPGSPDLYPNCL